MFSKVLIFSTICAVSFGQAIIFNPPQPQPFNNNNNFPRFLTPPRAITTLNTFVPRALIPPAPPRPPVPRVFDNRPRVYTAPPVFRPIPPAPPTRRFLNTTTVNNNINPRYAFNYGVNDNRTGDFKSQREQLENGVITGEYSLRESDGSYRRVTYRADDANGFTAVVEKTNTPINSLTNVNNNNNRQFRIFTR